MDQAKTDKAIENDVLHLGGSKLSQAEIDKALAHHKKHHKADGAQSTPAKAGNKQGKKPNK